MPRNRLLDVWRYVDMAGRTADECWPWKLAPGGGKGRGKPRAYFTVDGRKVSATRVIYEQFYGVTLSPGQLIRHKCDFSMCCNPHHMEIGSHQDNMDDMVERDRHGLPSHVVRRIRVLLMRGGKTHREIADLYGVDRTVVTRIANDDMHTHPHDYPSQEEIDGPQVDAQRH